MTDRAGRGGGEDDATHPTRLAARLVDVEPGASREHVRVVRAPGRVNLIGEHTDYNDGLVLPAAIGLELRIALVPTDDGRVEITLDESGERDGFDLDQIGDKKGAWIDYVAGTAWAMREAGVPVSGFRGLLASSIPEASGLSSSAALELASAWALSRAEAPPVDSMELARLCQRAENEYVGVRTGLMDQFAVSHGVAGSALLLDCRSFEWRPVPLPLERVSTVVAHTGSPRKLAKSEYNARREACEAAVRVLAERDPDIRSLRDVRPERLTEVERLVDPVTYRRVRHVVTENVRVLDTEAALGRGDLPAVGALFGESHRSLRDDYEVSSQELDTLVDIATSVDGTVGARMTGAGFGGCIVALVERGAEDAVRGAIENRYEEQTGLAPRVWVVDAVGGAGSLGAELSPG
jgi:galactokinase